jgi:hypothetical protein
MAVSHSPIGRFASRIAFDALVTNLPVCSTIGLKLREMRIDSREPRTEKPITKEICSVCRNIKTLFNFDPPVTDEEVRAASLQFVRKISGFNKPSKANEESFLAAVDEIAGISRRLLRSLETTALPKNREEEAAKAKARAAERFGAQA